MKHIASVLLGLLVMNCFLGCDGNISTATIRDLDKENLKIVKLSPRYESEKLAINNLAPLKNGKIWAVGYDGDSARMIRFSDDGGKNWQALKICDDFCKPEDIFFIDDLNGWITGLNDIFITKDGGKSWKKIKIKTNADFTNINFLNSQIGYIVGKVRIKSNENSEIWKTENGGETWVKVFQDSNLQNPFSILSVSENTALAILDEQLIITQNAGKDWEPLNLTNRRFTSLYKDVSDKIWVVGRDGAVFSSIDSGQNWNELNSANEELKKISWNSICFKDLESGIMVGNNGAVIQTRDSGKTWNFIRTNLNEDFRQVYCVKDYSVIVGSNNIYSTSQTFKN